MKGLKDHQLRAMVYKRARAVYRRIVVKPNGLLMEIGTQHHGFSKRVAETLGEYVPTVGYRVRYKPDPKGTLAVSDEKCVKRHGRKHKEDIAVCWLPSSWPAGLRLERTVKVLDGAPEIPSEEIAAATEKIFRSVGED